MDSIEIKDGKTKFRHYHKRKKTLDAGWDRPLTKKELEKLTKDPFCFLIPDKKEEE